MRRIIYFKSLMALLMGAALALLPAAAAQTSLENAAEAKAAAEKAREQAESRVDSQMVEMSDLTEALIKNIGQLHYLRALCFGEQDQYWRDFAGRMLQLEAGNDEQRRQYLTRAFNAGYFLEQERFKTCSADVSVDAAALAENGRRLATMLGDPYRDF